MDSMVDTKRLTKIVLAATTAAVIAYDIWVAVEPTKNDTISHILNALSNGLPIIPFAWGTLTAHLFSRTDWKRQLLPAHLRYVLLAVIGTAVLLGSIYNIFPAVGAVPWLAAGLLTGWIFWPQFEQNFDR